MGSSGRRAVVERRHAVAKGAFSSTRSHRYAAPCDWARPPAPSMGHGLDHGRGPGHLLWYAVLCLLPLRGPDARESRVVASPAQWGVVTRLTQHGGGGVSRRHL